MPTTFAAVDAATITALNAGDEGALERIFRSNYDWVLETALARLKGEDAAAPRLIATTVREFWDERDGFHTSAEIEAFFSEELRHRARAVRARMAAVHRFEKAEGVHTPPAHEAPSADRIWNEIATALHQPVVDPATAAKRRREQRSHGVAQHIANVTQRASWKAPVAIASVATVVALAGAWWFGKASRAEVINQMLGSADAQVVTTRAGQMGSTTLADNSSVGLAPETRLVIVPRFGSDYRTLTVSGGATFTVSAGNANAFEARLGDITVRSTGGRFSVRDYAGESPRLVRAEEGVLRVRVAGSERTLAAGEALAVDALGVASAPSEAVARQGFAWTEGQLVLADVTVSQAAEHLFRWYGLDIDVPDEAAGARVLSIAVPLESSQGAIAAIESGGQVRFQWVENRMTFQPVAASRGRR